MLALADELRQQLKEARVVHLNGQGHRGRGRRSSLLGGWQVILAPLLLEYRTPGTYRVVNWS